MSFLRRALGKIASIATTIATAPIKAMKAGIQQIKRLVRRGEQEIRQEEPTRERFQRGEEAPIVKTINSNLGLKQRIKQWKIYLKNHHMSRQYT
jgi:hypothetical protein